MGLGLTASKQSNKIQVRFEIYNKVYTYVAGHQFMLPWINTIVRKLFDLKMFTNNYFQA